MSADNGPYKQFLVDVFKELGENGALPKYQLERRLDVFISLFLPELLLQLFGWNVEPIAPEFPLKRPYDNQSMNVDQVLYRHALRQEDERWIFFELKTDRSSFRDIQAAAYDEAIERGMPALLADLVPIQAATRHPLKYKNLVEKLSKFPADRPIELVYLTPDVTRPVALVSSAHWIAFTSLRNLELKRHSEAWLLFRSIVLPMLTR